MVVGVVRDVTRRGFPGRESPGFDVIEFCGSQKLLLALACRHDVGNGERVREVHAAFASGRVVVSQPGADRWQHAVAAILVGHHHGHLLAHQLVIRDVIHVTLTCLLLLLLLMMMALMLNALLLKRGSEHARVTGRRRLHLERQH